MKVPAFGDIGRSAKDVLSSGYAATKHSLKLSTKTSGPDLTLNSTLTDSVCGDLKVSHKGHGYSVDTTFTSASKVNTSVSVTELAPGVKAAVSFSIPDYRSGKLAVDLSRPHLTVKSSVGLAASPKAECSVSTGVEGITLGGELGYDTKSSSVSKWAMGAQYSAGSSVLAAVLCDKGETVKASLAHELSGPYTVGVEAVHKLGPGTTSFTLGGAAKLDGATVKAKVDSAGIASALLETEVQPKAVMTLSGSFDALNLEKQPKVGVALNVKA